MQETPTYEGSCEASFGGSWIEKFHNATTTATVHLCSNHRTGGNLTAGARRWPRGIDFSAQSPRGDAPSDHSLLIVFWILLLFSGHRACHHSLVVDPGRSCSLQRAQLTTHRSATLSDSFNISAAITTAQLVYRTTSYSYCMYCRQQGQFLSHCWLGTPPPTSPLFPPSPHLCITKAPNILFFFLLFQRLLQPPQRFYEVTSIHLFPFCMCGCTHECVR